MKKFLILILIHLSFTAIASPQKPSLCSASDFEIAQEAFAEMNDIGIEEGRLKKGIGVIVGDCFNHYSLEDSAEMRHKMDMPPPTCGIIYVLSEENQKQQARWILKKIGKSYTITSGGTISVCSKISTLGPNPGATVHN